jgi:hypothetical protein
MNQVCRVPKHQLARQHEVPEFIVRINHPRLVGVRMAFVAEGAFPDKANLTGAS